ncbi:MAG: TIGR01777 family oxidoreductase [Dehalococcoidia bacterium]
MRVLMTGATGFIGTKACATLVQAGYEVVALSRNADNARRHLPNVLAAYPWAPLEGPPPAEAFDGVDAVVNLAGENVAGRWTTAKKQRIRDSRVIGTRNLVEGIRAAEPKPSVLISGSAHGYYGDRGDDELTESEPHGSDFLGGVCKEWEDAAVQAESFGVRVVRMRTALVVGPGGGFLKPVTPLYKFGMGGPLGSGEQWWAWVHLDDVTRLIVHAIAYEELRGPVNVAAPAALRQREFAKTMGSVLNRPAILPAPAFAIKLILGEFAVEVLSSKHLVPQAATDAGYAFTFPYLEPALRDAYDQPRA